MLLIYVASIATQPGPNSLGKGALVGGGRIGGPKPGCVEGVYTKSLPEPGARPLVITGDRAICIPSFRRRGDFNESLVSRPDPFPAGVGVRRRACSWCAGGYDAEVPNAEATPPRIYVYA